MPLLACPAAYLRDLTRCDAPCPPRFSTAKRSPNKSVGNSPIEVAAFHKDVSMSRRRWPPCSWAMIRRAKSTFATSAAIAKKSASPACSRNFPPTRHKAAIAGGHRPAQQGFADPRHPRATAAAQADRHRSDSRSGQSPRKMSTPFIPRTWAAWCKVGPCSCPARRTAWWNF